MLIKMMKTSISDNVLIACSTYGYWKGEFDVDCYNTHNASSPLFTDLTPTNSANRQWNWFLCNEP